MKVALISLAVGFTAGYLAQRSRLCFAGGLRDWLLFRDTNLLQGAAGFFLAAWLGFPLAALAGGSALRGPPVTGSVPAALVVLALGSGLILGLVSVLANGCPLRQHVLAAQGQGDAWAYLAGFAAGAVLYQGWLLPLLAGWIGP